MFNVLIDTSVWLDLAEKQRQTPLLEMITHMLSGGEMNVLVPQLVLTEFKANREKVAARSMKGLGTHFQLVRQAIREVGGDQRRMQRVLDYLADVDHSIPLKGGAAKQSLDRIETILNAATPIQTSDSAKLKAVERAVQRKGPCHLNKNSMADALLIEIYFECVKAGKPGERFAFVTHNKDDFSKVNGDARLPHDDIASGFSKIKSMYFIALADLFSRIDPHLHPAMKYMGYEVEPRGLTEILDSIDRLTTQVWHNRHMNTQWMLDRGKHFIVSEAEWDANCHRQRYSQTHTVEDIWSSAKKSRRRAERELGPGNFGPYSDFEWGMINGKLSALRWALGDDWDMLDT